MAKRRGKAPRGVRKKIKGRMYRCYSLKSKSKKKSRRKGRGRKSSGRRC